MPRSGEYRAFAVEAFFKNNESVIATQRPFRAHFRISPNGDVPTPKTILQWVAKFRQTGSTLNSAGTRWESRRELCANILQTVHRDAILMCSDESHFHLNSCVNKQNFRYWSETNLQQVHERPLYSARVTVWCAIAEFGVVGPYFF